MELSQKLLEAEDKRKSKELNDARDLQLSLLPHYDNNIGDIVLLMTDGLIELFNNENDQFGEERIKEVFKKNIDLPLILIVSKLFAVSEGWIENMSQNDDMTLVAFRKFR